MLDRIWQKNLRILRKLATNILADQSVVEDVVQDALTRVLSRDRKFGSEDEAYNFLRRTVVNTTIDYYRYRSRRNAKFQSDYATSVQEATLGHLLDPLQRLVQMEGNREKEKLLDEIRLAVSKLPARQQEAIDIVFSSNGKPIKETCQERGIPYSTVRSRMQAGLDRIRRHLKRKGMFPNPEEGTGP